MIPCSILFRIGLMIHARLDLLRLELFADVLLLLDEINHVGETSRDDKLAPLQRTHPEPSIELCGSCCLTPELPCSICCSQNVLSQTTLVACGPLALCLAVFCERGLVSQQ